MLSSFWFVYTDQFAYNGKTYLQNKSPRLGL